MQQNRIFPLLSIFLSAVAGVSMSHGQIIPQERLTTWEGNVGVPGGIPNRTTIYQTLNPGASASAIQAAINSCPAGQVVYLTEGTYNLGGGQVRIYAKHDWTLRGAGMGKTILTGTGSTIFTIGSVPWLSEWPAAHSITSGATKGSSSVTLADGTAGINTGELMVIEQPNTAETFGFGDGGGSTSATYTMDRMNNNSAVVNIRVMVTGISGNTVSFTPALPFTFWGSPRAAGYGGKSGSKNFGVEDMTLNGSTSSGAKAVDLMGCYGAWFKNVEFKNFTKRGITPSWSARLEFRGCYIHEGAGGHDTGYSLECGAVNHCLFEDNIWYKCQASLFLQGGCMANVIAYNVVFHTWNQDSGTNWMAGGFVANHAPYPMYNLYEGNYVNSIQPDFYYGGSRYGTILRNYLPGTDVATTQHRQTVSIDSRQWDYSIVGNVLGAKTTPSSIYLAKPNVTLNFAQVGNLNWTFGAMNTDQYGYAENRILRLGYPGIGSNGYSGTGDPPAPGAELHALDLSVKPGHSHQTIVHGNWDAANQAVTWHSGISDTNIPASLFRSGKPSWFGNLAWPPYDPYVPPTSIAEALARIPAGYRLLNNSDPGAGPADTTAPSVPQGLTSTAVGAAQINLAWTASTDNVAVTSYRVERSQGAGATTYTQVGTPTGSTFTDTGLTAGTVYNYRVRAVDAAGNLSGYSTVTTATTGTVPDTTVPSVPSNLVATVASTTQINLTWTASTDAVGVTGYRVERSQGAGSTNYSQIGTPTATGFNDTGLTAATVYNYRVRATDAAGNLSGFSTVVTATTSTPPDTTAPTVPTNLVATVAGPSRINLTWTASTDAVGVTGYRLERSQGSGSTSYTQVGTPTSASFDNTGLTAGTVYNYRVRAVDAAGNLSGYTAVVTATTATSDTTAPTAPSSLVVTASTSNQVVITWTASTDAVGVTGYRVERSQGAGSTGYTQVGTASLANFSDSGLNPSTVYNYRVRAEDAAGNLSGYSNVVSATTETAAPPTGLVAAYGFEELSGGNTTDASGSGNSGTITGATRTNNGKFGRALSFDGTSNVVVVQPTPSLNVSTAMTEEAWVMPTANKATWTAVLHRETDAYYLHASSPAGAMRPAGGAIFNGNEQYVASPTALPLNVWTHLATTYDGTTLRIYVNGSEVASRAMSGTVETNSKTLRIGGNTYSDQFFAGLIDEVRVYNRALSPAEIQRDMTAPVAHRAEPPQNLRVVTP